MSGGFFSRRNSPRTRRLRGQLEAADPAILQTVAEAFGLDGLETSAIADYAADNSKWEIAEQILGYEFEPQEKPVSRLEEDVVKAAMGDAWVEPGKAREEEPEAKPVVSYRGGPLSTSPGGGIVGRFKEATPADALEILPAEKEMISRARRLVETSEKAYFDLAVLISELIEQGVHKSCGYGDEREGVEAFLAREIGVSDRKAIYLLKIGRAFKGSVFRQELEAIGWSKAKEIAGLPPEEHEEAIAYAEKHSVRDVIAYRQRLTGREESQSLRLSVKLDPNQNVLVRQALDIARKRMGKADISDGFALRMALGEWMMNEGQTSLEESIHILETRHGVKLAIA